MPEPSQTPDHRLLDLWATHDLTPDPAEVEASRRFHLRYWLGLAEFAIARDHRQSCYGSLNRNIRELLDSIPNPRCADPGTIATLRHDLAFLEGNVKAYREIVRLLRELAEPERPAPSAQDCGSGDA